VISRRGGRSHHLSVVRGCYGRTVVRPGVRQLFALAARCIDQRLGDRDQPSSSVVRSLASHPLSPGNGGGPIGMVDLIAAAKGWDGDDPCRLHEQDTNDPKGDGPPTRLLHLERLCAYRHALPLISRFPMLHPEVDPGRRRHLVISDYVDTTIGHFSLETRPTARAQTYSDRTPGRVGMDRTIRAKCASALDATALVIPMFNEGTVIAEVVAAARTRFTHIVCVDDGSTDRSAEIARDAGATARDY